MTMGVLVMLFVLFMFLLLLVMVVALIFILRPRRLQRGFQVVVKPGEASATQPADENKS